MAPNSGFLRFAYDAALESDAPIQYTPQSRPDEPNVYDFPACIFPTYRSLPLIARVAVAVFCTWAAASSTFHEKVLWLRPLIAFVNLNINTRNIAVFLIKTALFYTLVNCSLQEVFTRPSRISTQALVDQYYLPSKLSNYERVTLSDGQSLGVHFLQHDTTHDLASFRSLKTYSALYLNHGFGASSLSWVPVIPKLADRLLVKRTLAHDAVGFGFTDRPRSIQLYTPRVSSDISLDLLQHKTTTYNSNSSRIILMGHSMGSLATLDTAIRLPDNVAVTVVLVAPALGVLPKADEAKDSGNTRFLFQRATHLGYSLVIRPILCYSLRRLVGSEGFWKKGLQSVWGNNTLVSDSDALRFQWPSVGVDWEDGLLRFAQAMRSVREGDLLDQVARRPNTRIAVILGSRDKVIRRKTVEKVFSKFPNVPILEIEGCGHDPFEENVDGFLDALEYAVSKLDGKK